MRKLLTALLAMTMTFQPAFASADPFLAETLTLGSPNSVENGFTVEVTNWQTAFGYGGFHEFWNRVEVRNGSDQYDREATIDLSSGVVIATGLSPGSSKTVCVIWRRYNPLSPFNRWIQRSKSCVEGTALNAKTPLSVPEVQFGSPILRNSGYGWIADIQIANYAEITRDESRLTPRFSISVDRGRATLASDGLVTIWDAHFGTVNLEVLLYFDATDLPASKATYSIDLGKPSGVSGVRYAFGFGPAPSICNGSYQRFERNCKTTLSDLQRITASKLESQLNPQIHLHLMNAGRDTIVSTSTGEFTFPTTNIVTVPYTTEPINVFRRAVLPSGEVFDSDKLVIGPFPKLTYRSEPVPEAEAPSQSDDADVRAPSQDSSVVEEELADDNSSSPIDPELSPPNASSKDTNSSANSSSDEEPAPSAPQVPVSTPSFEVSFDENGAWLMAKNVANKKLSLRQNGKWRVYWPKADEIQIQLTANSATVAVDIFVDREFFESKSADRDSLESDGKSSNEVDSESTLGTGDQHSDADVDSVNEDSDGLPSCEFEVQSFGASVIILARNCLERKVSLKIGGNWRVFYPASETFSYETPSQPGLLTSLSLYVDGSLVAETPLEVGSGVVEIEPPEDTPEKDTNRSESSNEVEEEIICSGFPIATNTGFTFEASGCQDRKISLRIGGRWSVFYPEEQFTSQQFSYGRAGTYTLDFYVDSVLKESWKLIRS